MLNPPNDTTQDFSFVIKITNAQAHTRYVYFLGRARLLFSLGLTHYYRRIYCPANRKTEALVDCNAATPWSSGIVLCFTPSPLLSTTRPRESVYEAQAPFPRASENPERGLLPRSMSANIPDSGSWHQDTATSIVRTDPFLGTHYVWFIRRIMYPYTKKTFNSSALRKIITVD